MPHVRMAMAAGLLAAHSPPLGACLEIILQHILPNGSVDPFWKPDANNNVCALVVSGTTVYAEVYSIA